MTFACDLSEQWTHQICARIGGGSPDWRKKFLAWSPWWQKQMYEPADHIPNGRLLKMCFGFRKKAMRPIVIANRDRYLWYIPLHLERGCEIADHAWLFHPPRSETHLDLITHMHAHAHSVRKGKYDKNALVMGFSSFKMIPSKCLISDINGHIHGWIWKWQWIE